MTTFKDVADRVSDEVWGFRPSRQVKPVHFANGFVRTLWGQAGSPTLLRKAAGGVRSATNRVSTEQFIADARERLDNHDEAASVEQVRALRTALDLVLNQDRAFFANGPAWSPTLTHRAHSTTDPSDQRTGAFLAEVLATAEDRSVIDILRRCLDSGTDNVYLLTAPLLGDRGAGEAPQASPEMVERTRNSPPLRAIQSAFATAVRYEARLEKTMFLQRVVTLGSFALFLHLINRAGADAAGGEAEGRRFVPILLCAPQPAAELREASRATFALARRQVERAFDEGLARELRNRGEDHLSREECLARAREWLPNLGQTGRDGARDAKIWNRFSQDFDGLLLGMGNPTEAFRRAAVRAAFVAMREYGGGEDPEGFGTSIGRMAGLVYPRREGAGEKYYLPAPQFLDMLVVALIDPDDEITVEEFWHRAERTFGILCGAGASVDAARLAHQGIRQASPHQLTGNARGILAELIRMGHAREYADDIAMIRAGGHEE